MATNNYMPMGRNPRSGGAGQAASYKKGGMIKTKKYQGSGSNTVDPTKAINTFKKNTSMKKGGTTGVAGVMKSGGTMKQGGGRIDRLANRANRISDRMTNIKEDMPDEGVLPPFAQRYGDKLNKKYARNENRLERVTKKIDRINSNYLKNPTEVRARNNSRVPPEKPNNPLNIAKSGGAKYQDKGTVKSNMVKGVMAINAAAKEAKLEASRPKMMKKIVKIKR